VHGGGAGPACSSYSSLSIPHATGAGKQQGVMEAELVWLLRIRQMWDVAGALLMWIS
jgi:hypothetical protein